MRVPSSVLCSLIFKKSQSFCVSPQWSRTPLATSSSTTLNALPLESFHLYQSTLHLWESYSTLLRESAVQTKATTAATLACTGDAVAQFRAHDIEKGGKFTYDSRRGAAFLAFGALYTGTHSVRLSQDMIINAMGFLVLITSPSTVAFNTTGLNFKIRILFPGVKTLLFGDMQLRQIFRCRISLRKMNGGNYFDLVSQIEVVMANLQDPPTQALLAAAKVAVNQFAVIPLVYMPLFFVISGALGGLDIPKSIARARSLYVPLLQRSYLFWVPLQFFTFLVLPVDYQIPFVCAASLCWTIILSSIGGTPSVSQSNIVAYESVESESL